MNRKQIAVLLSLPFFAICLLGIAFAQSISDADHTIKTGTVTGRFVIQGEGSMVGGQVAIYGAAVGPPPKFNKYSRVPNAIAEILAEGEFMAELPSGEYYLVAIKRISGAILGPPRKGDMSFRLMNEDNSARTFSIKAGELLDLEDLQVVPGSRERASAPGKITAIQGVLSDIDGNLIEKGIVFAYPTPQMQSYRPFFVSSKTGKNGKYILRVAGGKEYYLMARGILGGGKLEVGEFIGVYGANDPDGVFVKTGETLEGIDIKVFVVQPRGPREEDQPSGKPGIRDKEAFVTGFLAGEVVKEDGSPLSNAFVYLYGTDKKQLDNMQRPDDERYWWKLDHVIGQLDRHGKFSLEVSVGDYYLTIIKRTSGKVLEPLQEGDIYYQHRVSSGAPKVVTIKKGEETDLGNLVGFRYTERGITDDPNTVAIASIYGTLTDNKGKPVPNANILVYSEPDRLGPPLFSGGPSKADGSYNMMFFAEGTYYLAAKSSEEVDLGKKSTWRPGIMLGRYGGADEKPLMIKKGDVRKGIDIVLQGMGPPME